MANSCYVADGACLQPAGIGVPGSGWTPSNNTKSKLHDCMVCGENVCEHCSVVTDRGRLGHCCMTHEAVMAHLEELSKEPE